MFAFQFFSPTQVLPALPDDRSEQSRWHKTHTGFQMMRLASSLPSHGVATPEKIASVEAALTHWHSLQGAVFGESDDLDSAIEKIEEWHTEEKERTRAAARHAAEAAVEALEAAAGGGRDATTSWKDRLTADSSWEDLEREALHHLLPNQGSPAHKMLEDAFSAAGAAMDNLPDTDSHHDELQSRFQRALSKARATATESFLLHVICKVSPDRQVQKVRQRMDSMNKPPKVSPADLHPLIWSRCLAMAAKA